MLSYRTGNALKIYDGDSIESPIISQNCENRIPESIFSSGTDLTIVFETDADENNHGFLAHFDFLLVHSGIEPCGGVYTGTGVIRSPEISPSQERLIQNRVFKSEQNIIFDILNAFQNSGIHIIKYTVSQSRDSGGHS